MSTPLRLGLLLLALFPVACVVREREVIHAPGTAPASDACYVQVFDDEDLDESDAHTTIAGPTSLPDLSNLNGRDWSNQIESLIVGPGARVRAYKGEDFTDAALDFEPGQRVARLGPYDFEDKISSLQVTCGNAEEEDDDDDDDADVEIDIERR